MSERSDHAVASRQGLQARAKAARKAWERAQATADKAREREAAAWRALTQADAEWIAATPNWDAKL